MTQTLQTVKRHDQFRKEGSAENDRTGTANEFVRSLVGVKKKEALSSPVAASLNCALHEFEASNTSLEHEICRHCEESRVSDKSDHQQ